MNQVNYLLNDNNDDHRNIRQAVEENPGHYHLFQDNPLSDGCFLHSITSKEGIFHLISSADCNTGTVTYNKAGQDSFNVWSGGYASAGALLLACVAINGYHSQSSYTWKCGERILADQSTPLLYCETSSESYECIVRCGTVDIRCLYTIQGSAKQLEVLTTTVNKVSNEYITTLSSVMNKMEEEPLEEIEVETSAYTAFDDATVTHAKIQFLPSEEVDGIITSCDDPEKLHLLSVIGSGAFGQVHKAIWMGCIVAAEVIVLAGNSKVVDNELNSYRSLHHPNILTLMGIIKEKSRVIILTNLVVGKNLYELLHKPESKTKISYKRKVHVAMQITQALVYMHGQNPQAVRLDLKPENVLIEDETYHVYLADFGLGKIGGNAGCTTMQAGTPAFQPPEQLKGEEVGAGSDIYALACLVVELFSETQIWKGLSTHTIILKVAGGVFPSHDGVPSEIKTIVEQCFVPLERRVSAATFLKYLCKLL